MLKALTDLGTMGLFAHTCARLHTQNKTKNPVTKQHGLFVPLRSGFVSSEYFLGLAFYCTAV